MTASQADLDPHSPTTNGLFTIPQLFRIQTTLEPIGTRVSVPHQFAALSQGRYRPRLWVNRTSFPRNEVTAALTRMLTLVSVPLQEVKAALPGRASRMNQWTFFNKKIEAFKAQPNDGSTPSTPVKKATPGRAPNPTPDATERAPEGQVVVASQQVPEDQLVVAAQQHVYQPAMPYTHMVPQYPPPMPPMGYMPMLPSAMAPVAAPGGFNYMDIPQHPHLQFSPFRARLIRNDEGTEHRIERSMDVMDAARRSVNGKGTEHRIERACCGSWACQGRSLQSCTEGHAVEVYKSFSLIHDHHNTYTNQSKTPPTRFHPQVCFLLHLYLLFPILSSTPSPARVEITIREIPRRASSTVEESPATTSVTRRWGASTSLAPSQRKRRSPTQGTNPHLRRPFDLKSPCYPKYTCSSLSSQPQVSTANNTSGSQLGHYTTMPYQLLPRKAGDRLLSGDGEDAPFAVRSAGPTTPLGQARGRGSGRQHRLLPQPKRRSPTQAQASVFFDLESVCSHINVCEKDLKDEQQENQLTATKPQNHFARISSESVYGHGGDAFVKDEDMDEDDGAVVKGEDMDEDDNAIVKDEDMDAGCSERQFDKRVPRTAISISIYVDSN
ncbi:hypothetical protein FPRO04_05744 [Fusarium proliferatum]|nr:hypothetical protein FPRO04_05744 [Fusarium proliferatum]